MILKNADIEISNILLDPNNPRFTQNQAMTQAELRIRTLDPKEAKDLLASMKEGIKWINRIVVRPITTITTEEQERILGHNGEEYIVVEGNTRLACLKSGKLSDYSANSKIPVLIAEKEADETDQAYIHELHLAQGIANVTTVKDWHEISKARHLYKMHLDKRSSFPNLSAVQINKKIADELGMQPDEVRKHTVRYHLYNEISNESSTIEDEKWGFLEAFDRNEAVRTRMGIISSPLGFEWQLPNPSDEAYQKKELLKNIPEIISSAANENMNSKQFRDVFLNFVNINKEKEIQDFSDEILNIINGERTWADSVLADPGADSDEKIWEDKLKGIIISLEKFPGGSGWAENMRDKLIEIKTKAEKQLKILDLE